MRKVLAEFLNLTDDPRGYDAATSFIEKYGHLTHPLCAPRWIKPHSAMPEAEAVEYSKRLRDIWGAQTRDEIARANAALNEFFKAGDPVKNEGPAITADIEARRIKPFPRTLLHELTLELLYFPKSVGKCVSCGRYFVKTSSRDNTCPAKYKDGRKVSECKRQYRRHYQRELMRKIRNG